MLAAMLRSVLLAAVVLAACRASTNAPPPDATAVVVSPVDEPAGVAPAVEAPAPAPAPMPMPTHRLSPREPVPLDAQTTLRVEDVVIESIEPAPDDAERQPGGTGLDVTVVLQRGAHELRTVLTRLSVGYSSHPVGWLEDYRITLLDVADPHRAAKVALVVERVTEQDADGPPQRLRVRKGQEAVLDDGTGLTLVGHSHKRTMAGQRSPLVVTVQWREPGREPASQIRNLGPDDDDMRWTWRDLVVTVDAYDYDEWMDLTITRRALARVESSP